MRVRSRHSPFVPAPTALLLIVIKRILLLIKYFKVAQLQWNRPGFVGFSASPFLHARVSERNGRKRRGGKLRRLATDLASMACDKKRRPEISLRPVNLSARCGCFTAPRAAAAFGSWRVDQAIELDRASVAGLAWAVVSTLPFTSVSSNATPESIQLPLVRSSVSWST